jgi:hypothetical protein
MGQSEIDIDDFKIGQQGKIGFFLSKERLCLGDLLSADPDGKDHRRQE